MAHDHKTIPVGNLLLDTENPRHEPVASQRDAIQALIVSERQKLVVLANDIVEFGLSPIDRLLVIPKGRNFIVVEGNRRLAAIRLLDNPSLADDTAIERALKRVARGATAPTDADCAIVRTRVDAEHWMVIRHGGEAEGAGTVRWNAFAANRFSHKPGSQAAKAISVLEAVTAGYPKNEVIQELAARVAQKRLTTLGRLVQDPAFRDHAGMVMEGHDITFEYPAAALQAFFEHVLGDIASDIGVSQIKSKAQRSTYLKTTPQPDPKERLPQAKALSETPSSSRTPKPKAKRKPAKPEKPFKDLDLGNLGSKAQTLLREYRKLDAASVPNAVGVLTRVILELAVDEFISKKNLPYKRELKQRVSTCLSQVDPTGKANEYKALRAGLADGTSLYAVATLHAFVHNVHYHADPTTVRSFAANIQPFLQKLNDGA